MINRDGFFKKIIPALVISVATLVGLGLSELGVRLFFESKQVVKATPNQYKFYQFDSVLGWSNAPGSSGIFQRAEFSHPVHINNYGIRNSEIDLARTPGVKRVVVLGDSFTWGLGVSENNRFTERAEAILDGKFQFINFGVSGYGPIQYSLVLDKALELKPDVIVIAFCLGNDFLDNVFWKRYGYYKPYATFNGENGYEINGYPLPNVGEFLGKRRHDETNKGWLLQHSSLYRLIELLINRKKESVIEYGQKGLTVLDELGYDFYAPLDSLSTQKREAVADVVDINKRILRAMSQKAKFAGVKLMILPVVTKCEFGRCLDGLTDSPNWSSMVRLKNTARQLAIPLLDTSATLTITDFWDMDGHWRPSGHEKVGKVLASWMERTQLSN